MDALSAQMILYKNNSNFFKVWTVFQLWLIFFFYCWFLMSRSIQAHSLFRLNLINWLNKNNNFCIVTGIILDF